MKRRNFIKNTTASSAMLIAAPSLDVIINIIKEAIRKELEECDKYADDFDWDKLPFTKEDVGLT